MYFELYELTIALADRFKTTPFEFFKQECDEVISLINHFLEKGNEETKPKRKAQTDSFWEF